MFNKTYFMIFKPKRNYMLLFCVLIMVFKFILDLMLIIAFGDDVTLLLQILSIILAVVLVILYRKKTSNRPKGFYSKNDYIYKITLTSTNIQLFFNNNNCISKKLDELKSVTLSYDLLDICFNDSYKPIRININYFNKTEILSDFKQVILNIPSNPVQINF